MSVIYEPKGKAREYCELAINLYRGCGHGCIYCYAPNVLFMNREDFKNAAERNGGLIRCIEKEAAAYKDREIQLCLTCDPYQPLDVSVELTRKTIKILHENSITTRILTKGGKRSERDFDLLSSNKNKSIYGATLTFTEKKDSLKYEPDGAVPEERFISLEKAHKLNIRTWASLEPVIKPEQTLEIIHATHSFVDTYKIGKWNHDKDAGKIDWKAFGLKAIEILNKYNKNYYIKKDLAELLK